MTSPSSSPATTTLYSERVHRPHPHDVLCGRGGGINSHPGNQTFRNWVREKKEAYNLAANKQEKAKVSRDVLDQVAALRPPGRFLQREEFPDEQGPVWVQIDDPKAMAKTSQALREGAPAIRAKAKSVEPKKKNATKKLKHQSNEGAVHRPVSDMPSKVRPRSKSIARMMATKTDTDSLPRKRKLTPDDDTTLDETTATTTQTDVSLATNELYPIPENQDCIVTDPFQLVTIKKAHKKTTADEHSTATLTHCSSQHPTPTLLPVDPQTDPPPALHLFPLPPATFPQIPLSPGIIYDEKQSNHHIHNHTREQFPPLITPTNIDSNNTAILEYLGHNYASSTTRTTEALLSRGATNDMDIPFSDPFSSDNERFDRAIEGHPEFSATGLGCTRWNISIYGGNRQFARSNSNNSARSIMSELSDLPDCLGEKFYESSEWNKGMNDVLFARDLDIKSDVTERDKRQKR